MDPQELLARLIEGLEESVAYFAPGTTKVRERDTVISFIRNLHVTFADKEVTNPEDDPPDAVFRNAKFEIKEILDPGRRRHDEYKADLERARTITDPRELSEQFTPKALPLTDVYRLVEEKTLALDKRYPAAVRGSLDLLFYVNLLRVFSVPELPYPDTSKLASAGWRSVSFVKGQLSCCFYARDDAPDFIRSAVGKVSNLHSR